MSPRPRSATDAEILAGTARAIGRLGPARLTLADVAGEVGLAPATLLQRFGSKRGLLLALAEREAGEAARPFREARGAGGSPLDALLGALVELARGVETPGEAANHLAALQMEPDDPEFHAHALAHARAVRGEIADLLGEALAAGELRPCNPLRLARALHAAFYGSLSTWAIQREGLVGSWVRDDLEVLLAPFRSGPAGGV